MNNFQNLYLLFYDSSVFLCFCISVFAVFLLGIARPLFYLAGENASFLFDASGISNYISKTATPEPIRLKILFLSFPQNEKLTMSQYLKEPTQKPSLLFSPTLEQLKCKILDITNYNKNVAIFFLLVTALSIFFMPGATMETKLAGITFVALTLFAIYWFCNGVFSLLKFLSYSSFKRAVSNLDDFHNQHSAKFRAGLLPEQMKYSPFFKGDFTAPKNPPLPIKNANSPQIKPENTVVFKNFENNEKENVKNSTPIFGEIISPEKINPKSQNCDVQTLLDKIKVATETLDFECFEVLSSHLAKMATDKNITAEDHKVLQRELDGYLEEFRGHSPIINN